MTSYTGILAPLLATLLTAGTAAPQGVCGIHLPGASAGMGLCGTASAAGSRAVFFNPAATGADCCIDCSSGISRPFGIASISAAAVSIGFHARIPHICAGWTRIGNKFYIEESLLLSCQVPVLAGVRCGAALETERITLVSRDRRVHWYGTAGLLWRAPSGIGAGCALTLAAGHESNPVRPQSLRAGISFRCRGALCCCDVVRRRGESAEIHAGCEVPLCRFLLVRTGWVHDPPLLTAGFGIRQGPLTLDYSVTVHPQLGETHSCSISTASGGGQRTRR